ncbi:hypothetical protein [Desulfosporosinus sp. BICA1-9]|uniref:hypothetical protein n=1 Tax=Desulfosporosinus sp. BICA1-9 TaxID=1531958 RepID=UPI00054C45F2|nr:hypothetical protein [Desulfosporosinus sp. BICA1-9]KJS48133.1 MAG: hypothetical protein VR66_15575 [Peptococcaceae bacterium BRH_c23]KJS78401.1 MAG: hypothetical protein JL57_31775 [Desulfosporosinus sp. BICA1-9]HBW36567.1 hypothetical protein [Desulfosporosinus sp.]
MQLNELEMKKILDQGMLTRSIIENETVMKKCQMYNEMAKDAAVKGFFKEQVKGLEDVIGYFKKEMVGLQ